MKTNAVKTKCKLSVRIIALLCSCVLAFTSLFTAVFAWFKDMTATNPDITATAHRSYFESGTGTMQDPFEIARPVQLYYFSWLQQLGFFNKPEGGDNTIRQYSFYLSNDLDMTGYTLPPIGSLKTPFIGNFDGRGHIISNLKITNEDTAHTTVPVGDTEREAQVIGFFGAIGSMEEDGAITVNGVRYTYDTAVNSVRNFLLDGATIETKTPLNDKTLVGIVAGYVGGNMESVGVYNCSIKAAGGLFALDNENLTDKLSAYSLVGYSKTAIDAYVEAEGDEGGSWGGSIDMRSAHTRLGTAYGTGTNTNRISYTYRKYFNYFYDKEGNLIEGAVAAGTDSAYYKYNDYETTGGAFLLAMRGASTTSNQYYYLNGGVRISDTRYYYEDDTGYVISDDIGGYYLSAKIGENITQSAVSDTVWLYDNGAFYLEEVNGLATTADKYYLGSDGYGRVILQADEKAWTISGGKLYSDGEYLVRVNGESGGFGITDNDIIIRIKDGDNYLGAVNTAAVGISGAAEWLYSGGYIHTVINDTTRYLNRIGATEGVVVSSTPDTKWNLAAHSITTLDGYTLKCVGGTWKLVSTAVYFTDGNGNYLARLSATDITSVSSLSLASAWNITQSGYIYTVHSGDNYYLFNDGGSLKLTVNAGERTAWTISDGNILDGNFRIVCDNGFKLVDVSRAYYYLSDGSGHYLSHTAGASVSSTDFGSASKWILSGNYYYSELNPAEYLTYSNGLSVGTGGTAFTRYNDYLRATSGWRTYYVRYNNGFTVTTSANSATALNFTEYVPKGIKSVSVNSDLNNDGISFGSVKSTEATVKRYAFETLPEYVDYADGYATYFPLLVDKENSLLAKHTNTGYIVGGSYDLTTTMTYPYGSGDIRISYYGISGNISNSYSSASNAFNESSVYTINAGGTQDVLSAGKDNFYKYEQAKAGLLETLKGESNVYGLHFMSALISKNSLITAPQVLINGETYYNYSLPASSIDFNLKERGHINFFAGTYFPGNNSFFSLHRIFRDNYSAITDIKEIRTVYGSTDENKLYIYVYEDNTASYADGTAILGNIPSDYSVLFETAWIKRQTSLYQNYVYYFEIPADVGEYALGSVDGGTGAYLLYLDISANKGDIERDVMAYVQGVDFVTAANSDLLPLIGNNNPVAAFGVNENFSGSIGYFKVKREETANVITFTVMCYDALVAEDKLKDYIRYYYITPENKEVVIVWQKVN